MKLTLERLREVLEYDPESGVWVWKMSTASSRTGGRKAKPGKIAGALSNGYVVIRIDNRLYEAHRLAWFYTTGTWPKAEIDHINMIRADNRWSNLREATHSQNGANRGANKNSKSGAKGVTRNGKRWQAKVLNKYLGTFDTVEEARTACQEYMKQQRGEFARETMP
jgi:hypothetical protein